MKDSRIAIIGAGICGLAVGNLLSRAGHDVVLYERFEKPQSLGAGLLLQPIGLLVLDKMGLLDKVASKASRVDQMLGTNHQGKRIMDVRYADLKSDSAGPLFGLGVHRSNLFNALYSAAIESGVSINNGVDIDGWAQSRGRYQLHCDENSIDNVDAVIVANGTQSKLRELLNVRQRVDPYPWGALWSVLSDPGPEFDNIPARRFSNALQQRYQGAHRMAGVLPTGQHPISGDECVSFFWSLPVKDFQAWQGSDFNQWKQSVLDFEPSYADLLDQLHSHDDLTFARYGNVVMSKWHHDAVLCIGDAAHGMSPQLGLGANMALVDALVLNECLGQARNLNEAFSSYSHNRRKHLRYYQMASRLLTPMFQSNSRSAALVRDLTFPLMHKIPFAYKEALRTVSGIKTGVLFDRSLYKL